jgi:hypothetical protein
MSTNHSTLDAPATAATTPTVSPVALAASSPTRCCVTVHVQLTRDQTDGSEVDIVRDLTRVGIGTPDQVVRDLIGECLSGGDLQNAVMKLCAIDPTAAIALERLGIKGRHAVLVEAISLPTTEAQLCRLEELLADPANLPDGAAISTYVAQLARPWREANAGHLPVHFFDDDAPEPAAAAAI